MWKKFRSILKRLLVIYFYNLVILPILLRRIRKKKTLKVAFIAWNVPMWKYHGLYELLAQDPRFEPIVLLNPSPGRHREDKERDLKLMQKVFKERGYNIWEHVDYGEELEVKNLPEADLWFFTQPYNFPVPAKHVLNKIWLYVPYGLPSVKPTAWFYNNFMQNIAWKIFQPSVLTIQDIKEYAFNRARNCIATGYPTFDDFHNKSAIKSPWKKLAGTPKKIIWAPHFSFAADSILHISNFLFLHEVMLELAEEFRGKAQWAFKPHPFLLHTLTEFWGEEKTLAYYKRWESLEYAQVELGEYVNLFSTSDAIIHDCASFTIEYLYTKKPAMYLMRPNDKRETDRLGGYALDCYYKGSQKEEIRQFIENVVLKGNDPLKPSREEFYQKYLQPPYGKSVAESIFAEILRGLHWSR